MSLRRGTQLADGPISWSRAYRWMRTADSWLSNVVRASESELPDDEGLDEDNVGDFLWRVIEAATHIARSGRLSEDAFEAGDLLHAADDLLETLRLRKERERARTRVAKLEAVAGRTPEEAESYLRKASELRERHAL